VLIVKKFGGTSVGTIERIKSISEKIIQSAKQGHQIVVVVSAMSGETNRLILLAENFDTKSNLKDMDMILSSGERVTCGLLSMSLNTQKIKAYSLSGRGAGIQTDDQFTNARINNIDTKNMKKLLDKGYIVIVAGFQGIDKNENVTTLGRGGSDLSAVAIAGALKADLCEIYTDVDGIYTTDPRIEPKAKKINKIFYDSMLELSSAGAKVLHNRSVELAKKLNINLVVRNSFNDNDGTLITGEENIMEQTVITGIALDTTQARISIVGVSDIPGIAANIFSALSKDDIHIDMIVQTVAHDGKTNIDLTIEKNQLEIAKKTISSFDNHMHNIEYDENISKVSLVGVGMKSHSGVASKAFDTLYKENINIMMISTSEIKISIIIDNKYGELAVRALHEAYGIDK
jgi:aspartate kinase